MKKRHKHAFPIGGAVAWSICIWAVTSLVVFGILLAIPNSAVRNYWDLVISNNGAVEVTSPLYQQFAADISWWDLWVVSPITLLACGLTLGLLLRDDYGINNLYKTTVGTCSAITVVVVGSIWFDKLQHQGFRLNSWDLPPRIIFGQLLGIVLWVGVGVIGAEIGRRIGGRFSKTRTKPIPAQ